MFISWVAKTLRAPHFGFYLGLNQFLSPRYSSIIIVTPKRGRTVIYQLHFNLDEEKTSILFGSFWGAHSHHVLAFTSKFIGGHLLLAGKHVQRLQRLARADKSTRCEVWKTIQKYIGWVTYHDSDILIMQHCTKNMLDSRLQLHTYTLDKNGSLYDPAGTESWNMQIKIEITKNRCLLGISEAFPNVLHDQNRHHQV